MGALTGNPANGYEPSLVRLLCATKRATKCATNQKFSPYNSLFLIGFIEYFESYSRSHFTLISSYYY